MQDHPMLDPKMIKVIKDHRNSIENSFQLLKKSLAENNIANALDLYVEMEKSITSLAVFVQEAHRNPDLWSEDQVQWSELAIIDLEPLAEQGRKLFLDHLASQ